MPKIPVVLLPGFLCDRAVWESQIAALSDIAEFTVIDYGELDSLVAMADLVIRTAPAKFALAGHSMGGRIAFEVYRRASGQVTRIALMDTNYPPLASGEAGRQEIRGREALLEIARSQGIRAMSLKWLEGMIPPYRQKDEPLVESIVQMFERKSADDFARQMNALIHRPDATPVLSQIRCPALLLTGEHDAWSPPAAHERMSAAIPGSKLVIVPQCGHMSTMERPDEVAQAMRDWLAQ